MFKSPILSLRRVTVTLVIAAVTVAATAGRVWSQENRDDALRRAETSRRDALLAGDTVALSRLIAPEFYEVSRFGTLRTRAVNMREVAAGALKLSVIHYDSVMTQVHADVGILTAIADNQGTFQGTPFSGKIRYTRVFVWRDGRWQAVMMHQTPMP
jgi:hypothetical protein